MLCPISFAIGNLLRAGTGRADVLPVRLALFDCRAAALAVIALINNGPASTWHELTHASLLAIVCMLALGGLSTSIAYWLWGRLLRDYPAAQVVPFALLVPFVGAGASSIVFGEQLAAPACRHRYRDWRHRRHAAGQAGAALPEAAGAGRCRSSFCLPLWRLPR